MKLSKKLFILVGIALILYLTVYLVEKSMPPLTLVEQRTVAKLEVEEVKVKEKHAEILKKKQDIQILANEIDSEYREVDKEMYLSCIRIEKQRYFDYREGFSEDRYSRCREYLTVEYDVKLGYQIPVDLFYTYMKYEGVYISQTPQDHFKNNGLLATDIATGGRALDIYVPDINNEEKEYKLSFLDSEDYPELGRGVVLTSTDSYERWILGHVKILMLENSIVKTGDKIGITLCPGDEQAGATTGCHVHAMFQTGVLQEKKDKWYVPNFLEEPTESINWSATEYRTERNYFKHDIWKENREKKEKEIEDKGWYVKEGFDVFSKSDDTHFAWDDQVYKDAGERFGIDWEILSSIGLLEHRRSKETASSAAGALGAMQFLPCTWFNWGADVKNPEGCYGKINLQNAYGGKYEHPRGYASDGDGDGIADINNPYDSVYTAAMMIRANKDKCGGYQCAVLQYNHANWYVDQVMGFAYEMGLPYPTE